MSEIVTGEEAGAGTGGHAPRVVLAAVVTAGLGVSGVLYAHGSEWWIAPFAVSGFVLGHAVAVVGVTLLAAWFAGRRGETSQASGVLRQPRAYDWLVRVVTLGREERLRAGWLDEVGLRPGEAVLDVGCGTGTLLLAAAERVGSQGRAAGLEASQEMVSHARQKAADSGISADFSSGSADRLPYPDAAFDVVLCTLVLHHLPLEQQPAALAELRRVLRAGGRLLIVDLAPRRTWRGALTLVSLLHGGAPGPSLDLVARLAALGFEGLEQRAAGSAGLWATLGRLPRQQQGRDGTQEDH